MEPTLVSCAEIEQGTSGSLASSTAALLTACAYGPLNGFAFVAPSGTGLGCFARVRLQAGSTIGEIVGPRLPLRLFSPGKEAAAHACGLQQSHIALSGMNFLSILLGFTRLLKSRSGRHVPSCGALLKCSATHASRFGPCYVPRPSRCDSI